MLPDHLCVWRKEKITESFQHKNIGEDHSWSKAMALTYTELTTLVRNWCNRDADVVSDAIIKDCLKYAADKAYRTLRVPPLENVATYEKTLLDSATTQGNNLIPSKTEIILPYDLIEFIQIKELDSSGF